MKRITMLAVLVGLAGCGGEMPDAVDVVANTGTCLDMGILIIAAQTCPMPADESIVRCQADGSVPGGPSNPVPVGGCTIDLLRAPGQPYTATCVEECP